MISRIRLDAYGFTAGDVEGSLLSCAKDIDSIIHRKSMRGEQVIQRNLDEPDDSRFAFEGRLILHVDVSEISPTEIKSSAEGELAVTNSA